MIPIELWKRKLEQVYGPGEIMHGCEMSNEQACQWAAERFPEGRYCIVRDWVWSVLDVPDDLRGKMLQDQLQPAIILANYIVFDSEGRFDPGDWVRTSPLKAFNAGFIFQTRKTSYLLLGMGYRKRPCLKMVTSPRAD